MKKVLLFMLAGVIWFTACQKNGMMDDELGIDVSKYEKLLSSDYSNALNKHNALNTASVSAGDHSAHHGGNTGSSTIDTLYLKMMFGRYDSLFSKHFFEFCMDMMQNSGMMSTSGGMMGNNSGMMGGSGGMMNGTTMGSMEDMNKMMNYMDSLHTSTQTMLNPDYMRVDSLMYDQMIQCNMMIAQMDSIEKVFNNMQILRFNHRVMHSK